MKTLRSYGCDSWQEATDGFVELFDPSTEEVVARASSNGLDHGALLDFARAEGGASLRAMTFHERGELLMGLSKALHEHRDELIDLSILNTGVTRKDAKFDLDGATATLSYYSYLAKSMPEGRILPDGEGEQLGRSARFWGQHAWVPLRGAAVLINAYNFPAWGFAEKLACAFLAGVPVIVKPATSTALVAARCAEILVDSSLLPRGSFSFIAGSSGDLVDRLGAQDVLAFTGSASTGLKLRSKENLLRESTRVNIEADSLNAAVLAPDVETGSEVWTLFLREVAREITQKTGQKCTAVRRIFIPEERMDEVAAELILRLGDVVTGDPRSDSVTMGPLATTDQLQDTVRGVAELGSVAALVHGTGERIDGNGAPAGKGYFFGPTLLRADDAANAEPVHQREVFGPVATLLPYSGDADEAAELIGLGGGSLVTSAYSDDRDWVSSFTLHAGAWNGRLYLGSAKMAEQATGSGLVLPQSNHGGPGRAGGGQELGALRGVTHYMQRVALQGGRSMIDKLN